MKPNLSLWYKYITLSIRSQYTCSHPFQMPDNAQGRMTIMILAHGDDGGFGPHRRQKLFTARARTAMVPDFEDVRAENGAIVKSPLV